MIKLMKLIKASISSKRSAQSVSMMMRMSRFKNCLKGFMINTRFRTKDCATCIIFPKWVFTYFRFSFGEGNVHVRNFESLFDLIDILLGFSENDYFCMESTISYNEQTEYLVSPYHLHNVCLSSSCSGRCRNGTRRRCL